MKTRSFTLIEILTVMAIIAIQAALLVGGATFASRASAEAKTRSLLKQMELALEAYFQDRGFYPTEHGPNYEVDWPREEFRSTRGVVYLENYNPNDFRDGWDHPFYYRNDATEGYRLWSRGVDGQNGTEDDITSWTRG